MSPPLPPTSPSRSRSPRRVEATPSPALVAPVPFVILTGFLGAGKTTLLNRVLGAEHHRKIAVIVNELGRIDIDAGLIRARSSDVMELSGGCVCHQLGVQRELWSALDEIILRARPDAVILETSGVAEPAEIARGLGTWKTEALRARREADQARTSAKDDAGEGNDDGDGDGGDDRWPADELGGEGLRHLTLAAVVTVVDAQAGGGQIRRHGEAHAQVLAADQIVLSKTELVPAATLAELHGLLAGLNARAERIAFPAGAEGTSLLAPWLFRLTEQVGSEPGAQVARRPGGPHDHGQQLAAASYVDEAPLVAEALLLACRGLGARLVRAKGWVHIAGESRRGFLEVAGLEIGLRFEEAWRPDEKRMTRLVLIGDGLDEETILRQLWACRAHAP
jgi:G3E family GTPase